MKTPNTILRWLTLLAVIVNVGLSTAMERMGWGGASMREVTDRYDNFFVPAGYAFSIWGVIYFSFIVYAIVQLLPAQKHKPIYDHLAVPVILINLLGLAWQFAYRNNQISLSVVIILVMLVAGMVYFIRTNQGIWAQHRSKWLMVPSSLFLGWISVATIANVSLWLVAMGWDGGALSNGNWTNILLAVIVLLSLFISIRYKDFLYPAVIAWATYALFVALQNRDERVAQTAMYVAIAAIVLTIIAAARNARIELRHHRTRGVS
ncbi:tryptophan-rich sensory protein [Paraflavitalea pollutisoli]|uniref:tryptophan-rich sensory protein n=1 Tax=Paraflavitalea pollutisoli TaxID=3034143 RepID=UPI0023EDC227|nr:tryptophan-rich sensory protein [Paraflavitalea sp. H1-2-19X]